MPERSSNALLNAAAVFVLLTGGFLLVQQPIKSLRPQGNTRTEQQNQSKQLSRLWQDPFESARTIEKNQNTANASAGSSNDKISFNEPEDILNEMLWNRVLGSEGDFLQDKKTVDFKHKNFALKENEVKNALNKFRILAVMVPGKPYQDQVERRIRYRVALAHGMLEAGYHPLDAERIGCFRFLSDKQKNDAEYNEVRKLWKSEIERDIPVPYEWYQKRVTEDDESKEDILVLWIDEDRFAAAPLTLLNLLYNHIDKTRDETYCSLFSLTQPTEPNSSSLWSAYNKIFDSFMKPINVLLRRSDDPEHKNDVGKTEDASDFNPLSFQIIGPYSSTALHRIREESVIYTQREEAVKDFFHTNLTFYNYSATSQEKRQRKVLWVRNDDVFTEELFKENRRVSIHHLVSSDAMLMQAMHRELKLRDWSSASSSPKEIILLSENDTVYGRTLPEAFEGVSNYVYKGKYKCYRYGYLRGIDGMTAADANAQEQKRLSGMLPAVNEKGSAQLPSRILPGKHANPPVGNNQLDYIARLIMEIKQEHPRPFAVGILGSDPYDKLMLLQSLRLHFPDTLFFTTDFEAQYLDVESVHTAHGLLVASSYGLTLHPNIQKNTPPFRGTYQTALFHAVLAAIEDKKTEDKDDNKANEVDKNSFLKQQSLPRIFEIGWYNAVDLTMESQQEYKPLTNFHWERYNYSKTWKELKEQNSIIYENDEDENASLHPFSPRLTKDWKDFFAKHDGLIYVILLFFVFLAIMNLKLVLHLLSGEWLKELFPDKNDGTAPKKRKAIRLATCLFLFFVLPFVMFFCAYKVVHYDHTTPLVGGEPFFFWEGNSYWPIFLAHVTVVYLGIMFLFVVLHIFHKARIDVSKTVFPEEVGKWSREKKEKYYLNFIERFPSLSSIISLFSSLTRKGKTKTAKEESREGLSKDISVRNKLFSLRKMWLGYLKYSKTRFALAAGCFAVVFVLSISFFWVMFCQSDWTTYRGNGGWFSRAAVLSGMFGAFTMLNVLTGIVAASSIFAARFIAKISPRKELHINGDTGKDFSFDTSEHFRIVKLLGEWTHTTWTIIWLPVILLLILTVVRIFVFDNFGRGEIIRLCYVVTITLLIFVPVWKLRAKARNLRQELVDDLRNKLVTSHSAEDAKPKRKIITADAVRNPTVNPEQIKIEWVVSQVSDSTKPKRKTIITTDADPADTEQSPTANTEQTVTAEQIKIVIEEIEKYQKGIYSNNFWYPVVSVLAVLSGGISSPLLLEFLFK